MFELTSMLPFTVNTSVGVSVLIPMKPPSFIIITLVPSSIKFAISALPVCITSNAGPVPSFDIANLSVSLIFVSIV